MTKIFLTKLLPLALIFVVSSGFAQEISESAKLKRLYYLGKRFGISSEQAQSYVAIIEQSTNAANRVFRDRLLTDSVKRIKLKVIYSEKQKKLDAMFPNGLKPSAKGIIQTSN